MIKNLNNTNYILILILAISFIARLFTIHYYGDTKIDNEWGIILTNLENNKIFGYREYEGQVLPTIYMPPLYPIFLYLIKIIIGSNELFVKIILQIQAILSLVSIYYFYKILNKIYSKNIAFLGLLVFSLFPLNVYSVSQISSVSLQVLFTVLFFYSLINILRNQNAFTLMSFSITVAALIHLRGEFFIIYFLTLIYIFLKIKKIKHIFLSFVIVLILATPYLTRNYKTFGVITITKSSGYNLWRGNHLNAGVEGNETRSNKLELKLKTIEPTKKYDLDLDNMYMEEAINNIKTNPLYFFKLYLKKIVSFLFIDSESTYKNYYSYLNIVPKLIISIMSILGAFLAIRKKSINIYFSGYYFFNILLFSIFFILPRYSLMLLPAQVILSCYLLSALNSKFLNT
jgi:4-amino-4-deoxy-L-arabinose transferase-like glycosyltransferase